MGLLVVISTGYDGKLWFHITVHQAVFCVDPSGPIPLQFMLQWLWVSMAFKRSTHGLLNQRIDSLKLFFIKLLPIQVIFPCRMCPNKSHSSIRSCCSFFPAFTCFRDSWRWSRFLPYSKYCVSFRERYSSKEIITRSLLFLRLMISSSKSSTTRSIHCFKWSLNSV